MKTTEQMNQELQKVFPFLEIIDEYTGANNKCTIRCNDCGYEWQAVPRSVVKSKYGLKNVKLVQINELNLWNIFYKNLILINMNQLNLKIIQM